MGTFAELRAAALAVNKACGSLSIHFIDRRNVLRLGKALMRWGRAQIDYVAGRSGLASKRNASRYYLNVGHLIVLFIDSVISDFHASTSRTGRWR
jgi:hypothetical protein